MLPAFSFAENMIKINGPYDNNHISDKAALLSCMRHFYF